MILGIGIRLAWRKRLILDRRPSVPIRGAYTASCRRAYKRGNLLCGDIARLSYSIDRPVIVVARSISPSEPYPVYCRIIRLIRVLGQDLVILAAAVVILRIPIWSPGRRSCRLAASYDRPWIDIPRRPGRKITRGKITARAGRRHLTAPARFASEAYRPLPERRAWQAAVARAGQRKEVSAAACLGT